MSITYSECVFVALGIEHAMRMRRIILPGVACLALPYFLHASQTARFARGWGVGMLNKKYLFWLSFEELLILRRNTRYIITNVN